MNQTPLEIYYPGYGYPKKFGFIWSPSNTNLDDGVWFNEHDGCTIFVENNKVHRIDGPACICRTENGYIFSYYYFQGISTTFEVIDWIVENDLFDLGWQDWTPDIKMLYKLRFG